MGPLHWGVWAAHAFPQLSSLVQIGKTGLLPPPRSLACGAAAPPLPDRAKEVAWAA